MTYRIFMCGLLLFFSPSLQANTAKQLQHHEIITMQQNLAQLYQAKDAFQIEESLAIQEFQKMSGNERATDNQQRLDQEYANLLIECAPERVGEIIEECKLSLACKNKEDRDALRTTSLLLVGPPGNGKSDLARAIAQAMGVPFVFVDCGNLANEYQNSATSNLDKAIKHAESLGNGFVVVVLDELQALTDKKKYKTNSQDPAFCLGQEISKYENHKNVMFIATANYIKDLPDNIASRFKQAGATLEIPLPSQAVKKQALQFHLKSLLQEELVDEKAISRIIDQTDNFSCRDYKGLCARIRAQIIKNGRKEKLSPAELNKIIDDIKKSNKLHEKTSWQKTKEFLDENHSMIVVGTQATGIVLAGAGAAAAIYSAYKLTHPVGKALEETAKFSAINSDLNPLIAMYGPLSGCIIVPLLSTSILGPVAMAGALAVYLVAISNVESETPNKINKK